MEAFVLYQMEEHGGLEMRRCMYVMVPSTDMITPSRKTDDTITGEFLGIFGQEKRIKQKRRTISNNFYSELLLSLFSHCSKCHK